MTQRPDLSSTRHQGKNGIATTLADEFEGRIDFVIFFSDPLEPQPHDVDVKALLRVAVVYNVPMACNRASADFLISSPLMKDEYRRLTMGGEDQIVCWIPAVPLGPARDHTIALPLS